MADSCDVIVIGLGGFGSSALYHLARQGHRVLGIEQFGPAHDRGSSHGETRVIRKAYFEHPDYVPLLKRAYELWAELEDETQSPLYEECGLMLTGPPEGEVVTGARLAAREHGVRIDEIEIGDARDRFAGFHIPDGFEVVHEPEAGFLRVEDCVRAHLDCAVARGAVAKFDEPVAGWQSDGSGVAVRTEHGEYRAQSLIVTAGAWAKAILGSLDLPLRVLRKVLLWNPVRNATYDVASGGGTFLFEMPSGHFYGFPSTDGTLLKLAEHTGGRAVVDPLQLDRGLHNDDVEPVADFIRQAMPDLDPAPQRHSVCMYTMTPDGHFVVDRHPDNVNVVYGAGFSGHGFKFTSAIGESLAELAISGTASQPVSFLSADRPVLKSATTPGS